MARIMKQSSITGTVLVLIIAFLIFAVIGLVSLPPRDVTLKDMSPAVLPQAEPEEPATPVTSLIETPKTGDEDKEQVDYFIIIESFRDHTLAQEKAEKLMKAFNTNIIVLPPTAEGFFRISYGKYSTLEEAESAIKSIRTIISSDAWVFTVKK
jgi:cell division protein FtsN